MPSVGWLSAWCRIRCWFAGSVWLGFFWVLWRLCSPSTQGGAGGVSLCCHPLVGVSAASGVVLGSSGFEVLGARVVDSRGPFTAPDPLVLRLWVLVGGADPFSLVGGNPVSLVDPWGLSPVSVGLR